jgi:proteasome accessory factor C
MADYFSMPLRLSPAEALVLYTGVAALTQLPGMDEADALRRSLDKLGRALGTDVGGESATSVQIHLEAGPAAHLSALQDALERSRRVRMEYFSASRGVLTHREVDPWGLIAALGRWYLVGFDHLASDERMFRVDRIKTIEVLELPSEVPADFDPAAYRGAFRGGGQATLSLEISPGALRWFEDYYPVRASVALDDGWRRLELESGGIRWAATLVLRLGSEARSITPASVREEARRLARDIAVAHGATEVTR